METIQATTDRLAVNHVDDLATLTWVFETGVDVDEDTGEEHPYRTVFALEPDGSGYYAPLADLAEEADDNVGRLMAAAPDLLRALKILADLLWYRRSGYERDWEPAKQAAEAALAKARGER